VREFKFFGYNSIYKKSLSLKEIFYKYLISFLLAGINITVLNADRNVQECDASKAQ